jgi:UDP-GlcNAc:undecaprenyl-phosphate GlcNAc-1-phosphate transferase
VILFVWSFVVSLAISLVTTFWVQKTAVARGLLVPPASDRHLHTKPLPRIGGVGIYLAFLITVVVFCAAPRWGHRIFAPHMLIGFLIATCSIFLVGAYDDLKSLRPQSKLIFEFLAAIIVYFSGFGLHNISLSVGGHAIGRPLGFALTVIWVLLITNAFNLIDGLDGLAVGTALLSAIVVIATSLVQHNDLVTMLSCALFGTLLGFVPFNFHPASIFMGDSGSLFIGFALGALSLSGWRGRLTVTGVAVPILCFGLPIADVTLAVARRFLTGQPLFRADADHVHHKLLKRGLSQQHAVLVLYGVTAGFVLASILLIRESTMLVPVLAATSFGLFWGVQQLHYQEFSGGWFGLQAYFKRRQIARAQRCIRQASYSLDRCGDFRSICRVLRDNLQPIGIDGIGFKVQAHNGLPPGWLRPLHKDPEGNLFFSWSRRARSTIVWQYCFQLPAGRHHFNEVFLFRVRVAKRPYPEVEIFSDDFKMKLSTALERAIRPLDIVLPAESNNRRSLAPNSLADSA